MGMEHRITPGGRDFSWSQFTELLAGKDFPVQLRMIDGELSFPDETPPDTWHDLRVGTPQGMITLRREADALAVVTWGDADSAMRQAWNAITWAAAATTDGRIDGKTASEFAREASLPAGWQA